MSAPELDELDGEPFTDPEQEPTERDLAPPNITRCEACGQEYRIGDWPFCPHGVPRGGIIADTLPGGAQWIENLGPEPVWVESKTQLQKEAAARGLRWDPKPQPKGIKPRDPSLDERGRYNGGAFPTYREHVAPAPEAPVDPVAVRSGGRESSTQSG